MKNKLLTVLPVLTALFVGLTLGLYLGRNPAGGSVTVSIPERQAGTVSQADTRPETDPADTALPVNINTAGAAELARLPGIGEVLAQRLRELGYEVPDSRIVNVGAAVGAHIGANACGIVYIRRPRE